MNVFVIANVVIVQCRGCCGNITMDVFAIVNVVMVQRRRCCANIPMNISAMMDVITMQLGTSCSFDSPGLARNEPTPGKRLHGDSTPKVLSFFCEGIVIARGFMADYA